MPTSHPPRDLVLRLIAAFKLLKALALMFVALGALSLLHRHNGGLGGWIDALVFDGHGKHLRALAAKVGGLDQHQLTVLGVGSMLYAATFSVEGIGLMLRRMWAEVLTVIITTSFIPLELYELVENRSWAKAAVIAINLVVVVYLVLRLRRERGGQVSLRQRALGE